jgi:hypothetical protein
MSETKTETNEDPMRFGAVAILDALGFKGLWGRYSPQEVAGALRRHKAAFSAIEVGINAHPPGSRFRFLCLSDTLVFSIVTLHTISDVEQNEDARRDAEEAVRRAVHAAQTAIMLALAQKPVLVFRGCIAAGALYAADDDYLIGGAVDEAAEYMDEADGAFVWLLPSATRLVKGFGRKDSCVVRFPVPMHGGRTVEVPVVNPLESIDEGFESPNQVKARRNIRRRTLEAFTDPKRLGGRPPSLDVVAKMQNTKRFLDEAERVTAAAEAASQETKEG